MLVLKQALANRDLLPSFFSVNRQRVLDALQYLIQNDKYIICFICYYIISIYYILFIMFVSSMIIL